MRSDLARTSPKYQDIDSDISEFTECRMTLPVQIRLSLAPADIGTDQASPHQIDMTS
jgi:hypothetical protein